MVMMVVPATATELHSPSQKQLIRLVHRQQLSRRQRSGRLNHTMTLILMQDLDRDRFKFKLRKLLQMLPQFLWFEIL